MKSGLGALLLTLVVACTSAGGSAAAPAGYPYVAVNLAPKYTVAQRRKLERALHANRNVRAVQLITLRRRLAAAQALYKQILPPADQAAALRALRQSATGDLLCVKTVNTAAADRLFARFNLIRAGVASISKYSGGEMYSACNLIGGVEHTRRTVPVPPPTN